MKITLMVMTYNWKEALALCLESAFRQTRLPHEIIVADDGSREDTAETIGRYAAKSPVPLAHVWQPDEGFRLAASRNRGIAASSGDYIIVIDGDVLLERHFCEDHERFAAPGRWIQGSRVLIGQERSKKILESGLCRLGPFSRGIHNRKNAIRSRFLAGLVRGARDPLKGVRGCNVSFWRDDAVRVNGYNEAFVGWGREDSEFAVRLANAGVVRKNLKHQALVFHLYHPENSRKSLPRNELLLQETIDLKKIRCEKGLAEGDAGILPPQSPGAAASGGQTFLSVRRVG
jgi:glycosyltransferase involved in cell wall biosynthesis